MGIVIEPNAKNILKDTYLWRYMSLPKFLDLITTQTLYFSTNTQLITGDPYEGTLPFFTDFLFNLDKDCKMLMNNPNNLSSDIKLLTEGLNTKDISLKINDIRDKTFINCWHINDDENYLMWQSYAPESGGVAIVTDIFSLIEAIEADVEIEAVPIKYNTRDFNKSETYKIVDDYKELALLVKLSSLYKREFFKGENELRLIYQFGNNNRVGVKLDKLIKHIYLSPKSTEAERQIIINSLKLIRNKGVFSVDNIDSLVSNSFISHTYKNSANNLRTFMGLFAKYLDSIEVAQEEQSKFIDIFLLSMVLTDIPSHKKKKEILNKNT